MRVIIETYCTFNHLFVNPYAREEEKKCRFLIWKLEGLLTLKKMKIGLNEFDDLDDKLSENEALISSTIKEIDSCLFFENIDIKEKQKIYHLEKKKINWKFEFDNKTKSISSLTIIGLIERILPQRTYFNLYKYTSMHTHSGYISVLHYEQIRSTQLSETHFDDILHVALDVTYFLIKDICTIDKNALEEYEKFSIHEKKLIEHVNKKRIS